MPAAASGEGGLTNPHGCPTFRRTPGGAVQPRAGAASVLSTGALHGLTPHNRRVSHRALDQPEHAVQGPRTRGPSGGVGASGERAAHPERHPAEACPLQQPSVLRRHRAPAQALPVVAAALPHDEVTGAGVRFRRRRHVQGFERLHLSFLVPEHPVQAHHEGGGPGECGKPVPPDPGAAPQGHGRGDPHGDRHRHVRSRPCRRRRGPCDHRVGGVEPQPGLPETAHRPFERALQGQPELQAQGGLRRVHRRVRVPRGEHALERGRGGARHSGVQYRGAAADRRHLDQGENAR